MADRDLTELSTTEFADGKTHGVKSYKFRDLITSLTPGMGRCDMQGNAVETVISGAGTYAKVLGTTSLSGFERSFDDDGGTSNRLRYIGAAARHMHIAISFDFVMVGTNKVSGFKVWVWDDSAGSGSYIDSSLIRRKVGTGTDVGAVAAHADCMMDTNDYIELHATNITDTGNLTVEDLNFFVMSMPT